MCSTRSDAAQIIQCLTSTRAIRKCTDQSALSRFCLLHRLKRVMLAVTSASAVSLNEDIHEKHLQNCSERVTSWVLYHLIGVKLSVVVKVHRSSTWVKVQIRILKYYSSKSKSTAFSILLEWKYKSTHFFMYLSKKVLIDRFILQFYIDYFIKFYINTYFYNPTAQNTWVYPKITTI